MGLLLGTGYLLIKRRVTGPINALRGGIRHVQEGDLDHSVRVGVKNELGELADTFGEMVESIRTRIDNQSTLRRIHEIPTEETPLKELLEHSLDLLFSLPWLGMEPKGCIFLSEEGDGLTLKAHKGFSTSHLEVCGRIEFGECLCGRAAETGEVQTGRSDDHLHELDYPGMKPHRHYCLPIVSRERETLGVLNLYLEPEHQPEEEEMDFLSLVADSLADIILHYRSRQRLEETTIGALRALSRTVEAKDEYTGEHIDRVKGYALEVGEELGLSGERLDQLSYASELHDIGKVRISDSILGKPDELTEGEREEMERHPAIGAEIVGKVPRLEGVAKTIAQHQEHYDGTGYPEGLAGDEITLEARIIAVVDAWDAMRTDRPYRDALPREVAIDELKENAGTQFDPRVAEAFLEVLESR